MPCRVEVAADQFRRYRCRVEPALGNGAGDLARRTGDLLPAAVVEGDDEIEPVIVAGQRLGVLDERDDVGLKSLALADDA